MANDTSTTITGYLVADPQLKYTPSGQAVVNFTVGSTPRYFDGNTNEWKDGETLFLRCSVWRRYAENIAESLVKGSHVIVTGNIVQRSYEVEGEKRYVVELRATEVGACLRSATAKVSKNPREGAAASNNGTPPPAAEGAWDPSFAPQESEPPF